MPNSTVHQRFFTELKRRRVFRVMAVYGVVGFVLLQVVDLALPALLLPEWTYRLVALLVLIGFPIAIVLAWAFELTPEGVQRTRSIASKDNPAGNESPTGRYWPIAMAAFAGTVLLGVGAWWVLSDRSPLAQNGYDSIAVLPFVNMTGDPAVEYLGDGIAEELRNALTGIPGVHVPSMTSAAAFKDSGIDIRDIGQALDVALVLEGSVRGASDRLRVTAQLIDAQSGFHVWRDSYDRASSDLLDLQDELTAHIVEALVGTLRAESTSNLTARGTESAAAYDFYLQGRYFWNKRTLEDIQVAISLFQEAAAVDPGYAPAWAAIAEAWAVPSAWGDDPDHALNEAERYAHRALEIDSTLAQAHTALGYTLMMRDLDFRSAEAAFERALDLDSEYATAHQWRAELLSVTGRDEKAVEAVRTAEALDPTAVIRWNVARILYFAGRFEEAIVQVEPIAREGAVRAELAYTVLLQSWLMLEDYESARSVLLQAFDEGLGSTPTGRSADQPLPTLPPAEELPRFLATLMDEEIESGEAHFRQGLAAAAFWAGIDTGKALDHLAALTVNPEEAIARVAWFEVLADPAFDILRDHPRYRELNASFGLGDAAE